MNSPKDTATQTNNFLPTIRYGQQVEPMSISRLTSALTFRPMSVGTLADILIARSEDISKHMHFGQRVCTRTSYACCREFGYIADRLRQCETSKSASISYSLEEKVENYIELIDLILNLGIYQVLCRLVEKSFS
ncbi:MAG: hypothetical protein KDD67_12665 [Ignavibacteriae bacterium]|nr:hypothetical protein [Ignavibacteriota bacterium]MCB9214327.1 hypothetical protein [Ignavibacteria bacterium]